MEFRPEQCVLAHIGQGLEAAVQRPTARVSSQKRAQPDETICTASCTICAVHIRRG